MTRQAAMARENQLIELRIRLTPSPTKKIVSVPITMIMLA
jgi:hypothetical protein